LSNSLRRRFIAGERLIHCRMSLCSTLVGELASYAGCDRLLPGTENFRNDIGPLLA
jgi:2-keto-3-deoxy-L-rhamnonate aldolase RhmA